MGGDTTDCSDQIGAQQEEPLSGQRGPSWHRSRPSLEPCLETPLVRMVAGVVGQRSCSICFMEEEEEEKEEWWGAKMAMQFHNHADGW